MTDLIDLHLDHLRAGGYADRTVECRRVILRRLHYDLPFGLAYAAPEQLEAWLAHPGWSRGTRLTYTKHIREFYKWAAADLGNDPAVGLKRPKAPKLLPKPVTDAELARALAESAEPWYTVIVLAAYAGLRASEAAAARREHVDPQWVLVPVGKGGDPGTVPTHPLLWEVVRDRPAGPLALREDGRPVTGRWLSANARAHFDALGMQDVHLHRFRHWFGTSIQARGGDIRVTQECLRHASISSTQGYTMVTGQQRASAVMGLPSYEGQAREIGAGR